MAKQKITANGELDILTMGEVRSLMREWKVDVAKGLRPISFSATGVVRGDGTWSLGGAVQLLGGQLGPLAAFWWAVDRVQIRVNGTPLATAFSVYQGSESSLTVVRDVQASAAGYTAFTNRGLMLSGGDTMVLAGTGAAPAGQLTVSGAAIEIPQALLWRWLS